MMDATRDNEESLLETEKIARFSQQVEDYQTKVSTKSAENAITRTARNAHWSDCALHNEPATLAGPCNCGAARSGRGFWTSLSHLVCIRGAHWRMRLRSWIGRVFR